MIIALGQVNNRMLVDENDRDTPIAMGLSDNAAVQMMSDLNPGGAIRRGQPSDPWATPMVEEPLSAISLISNPLVMCPACGGAWPTGSPARHQPFCLNGMLESGPDRPVTVERHPGKPVYMVMGVPRSGTSMMMRAIALASNIPVLHSVESERLMRSMQADPSYDPNPNGYWHPPHNVERDELGRWVHRFEGYLVKVRAFDLTWLPPGRYQIVATRRRKESVKASHMRAFAAPMPETEFPLQHAAIEVLSQRKDVTLTVVNYEDVVADPEWAFRSLQADGWPIQPDVAASTIDPKLQRNAV